MTGAYLRIKRDTHYKAIEVEYLTDAEREELFQYDSPEVLIRWINLLCNTLKGYENYIEGRDL